jgi:hypothetical protein
MHHLTTGIHSEKCIIRQFHHCANILMCTVYFHKEGYSVTTQYNPIGPPLYTWQLLAKKCVVWLHFIQSTNLHWKSSKIHRQIQKKNVLTFKYFPIVLGSFTLQSNPSKFIWNVNLSHCFKNWKLKNPMDSATK